MQKKFLLFTLIFLLALPSGTLAAVYNYTNTDPFHLSAPSFDLNGTTLSPQYSTNNLGDIDFFYQVRDITGETYSDAKNVGGPQWFATVYENYSTVFNVENTNNNQNNQNYTLVPRSVYRRTLGGQTDGIPVSVIGDILDGFNFVFAEEPEPYEAWMNNFLGINDSGNNTVVSYYDRYPDPLETLCVITSDGTAKLNVQFANPYARHFPFWWNWNTGTTISSGSYSWWQNTYDWTNILAKYTTEPVAYIYDPDDGKIYSRPSVYSKFSQVYAASTSNDVVYINDLSGNHLYVTSGDTTGTSFQVCSGDTVYYTVANNKVYNSSGSLVYTLESAWNDNCIYVCSPRYVKESILVQGLDDYEYQINVNPAAETDINSAEYLNATINIRGDSETYGSKLAYITFRQRASFMQGYENFREVSPIPLVFANVSKGNAADNPLIFDFAITNPAENRIIKRMKFKWDAQSNLPDQDLGTFFIMKQVGDIEDITVATVYDIEAKITNRTGTRYMLYRYDRANPGEGLRAYTLPKYWKFDLTEDTYGTLPKRFLLDSHSQIAPGLITVYSETLDITKDTAALDSFRLYEYNYTNPKDLWLNYKRVGGMYVDGSPAPISSGLLADASDDLDLGHVQTFTMDFVDIKNDDDNTENEIQTLTGKIPVLPSRYELSEMAAVPVYTYISASALDSFSINKDLSEIISFYEVYGDTGDTTIVSSDTTSGDTSTTISTDKMAVMPMNIRLKIPRKSQLLKDAWGELDAAEDSQALFRVFNKYGTVRVRSSATNEYDADLFRAIGEKGSNLGVSAQDCVSAFIYEDYLYLDFMVFAADAVSKNTGKTAFVEIFKDDDVPYVIVGDGNIDKAINLSFYIDAPLEAAASASSQNNNSSTVTSSSGGGASCNINAYGFLILLAFLPRKFKK